MAKCFNRLDGVFQFRATAMEDAMNPAPVGATVVEFDDAALIADIRANQPLYSLVGSELRKNNVAVTMPADSERLGLKRAAAQAVADNDAYLAIASPSNAQVAAQVRKLTQQNTRLIRRLVELS